MEVYELSEKLNSNHLKVKAIVGHVDNTIHQSAKSEWVWTIKDKSKGDGKDFTFFLPPVELTINFDCG